ncbi:response regulator [Bythopirellula goksoeyrii]|uniref:Transcriptional regulatory protein LiaR n=1 Tax=Bythopirellula goksoeyrii TaxID=1400387 RepID=A0A5B9Q5L3_9BACT|nr:response regulator transcription factor [Bythopirellula goksoeyrii]QEG32959.1 Transcriptional regulatory protein LiaR [Bythopirellula goksoeyrii]
MSIRLLIADDHAVVRAGITAMLSTTDIAVVAEACDGTEALQLARKHRPDVALLDVRMPELDGMACLSKLGVEFPDTPVIMFSAYRNPTYIARAVALGAIGYLTKTSSREELIEAIRLGASGESLWSRDDLRAVSGSLSSARLENALDVPLTKRENEVLKQLALGLSNKEIAQALSISYETVKEHVQHVLRKLGVSDRTQAAVWAVRNGLV